MDLDRIQDMYAKAQREIAEVWNAPWVLDIPLTFVVLPDWEDAIADTQFNRFTEQPYEIRFNLDVIPEMDPDEIQYGLFHELTHASLPYGESHGEMFVDRVSYTTGVYAPWVQLRAMSSDDTLDNPPTVDQFEDWPNGY